MDINSSSNAVTSHAVGMGNVLFANVEGQPADDMRFFMNCIYIALDKADKTYSSDKKPGPWFDHFVGMLWSMGWTAEGESIERVEEDFSGSVQKAWRSSVAPLLTRAQLLQVEASLARLESDVALLNKFVGLSGKTFNSHIVPVSYNRRGEIEIVISHVRLIKSVLTTNVLFWQVHQPQSQLDVRACKLVITRRALNANQTIVEQAIGEVSLEIEEYEI
ncbi:hypothetical protein HU727_012820 [Pseudomonas sp. SWRI153]|uniref:Uncharacterized protein n=1 Tax=Pseudomonas khorasanensis TaxID=2745508 RepID=A0A923JEW1_9PSED|nr:hypothetical protein [Pseudomonas khorasanensis]MBV4486476.1 hypothetical protein [Pseudomonas khorasanensis]